MENLRNLFKSLKKHRDRALTIVYYWPLGRSRTLELSSKTILTSLSIVCVFGIWGIVATIWSLGNMLAIRTLESELREARDAVFAYQATYEDIFEQAYPTATEPATSGPATTLATPSDTTAPSDSLSIEERKPTAVTHPKLVITKPKVSHDGQNLHIAFKLANKVKSERIAGHIYAVAEIAQGKKPLTYIGSSEKLDIDPNSGIATNPKAGETFAVRRFRTTDLIIPIKTSSLSSLRGISISVVDRQGNLLIQLPVEDEQQRLQVSDVTTSSPKG